MKLSEVTQFDFKLKHLLIPYILIAILAFGHAWQNIRPAAPDGLSAGLGTIITVAVWPLYVSTQIWKVEGEVE